MIIIAHHNLHHEALPGHEALPDHDALPDHEVCPIENLLNVHRSIEGVSKSYRNVSKVVLKVDRKSIERTSVHRRCIETVSKCIEL